MEALQGYDILVTDLLGHGRSGAWKNYSFQTQTHALSAQLKPITTHYQHLIFVPHSMGGIHATLLASQPWCKNLKGIFAVETGITQYGSFVARRVYEAIQEGWRFEHWFRGFCDHIYCTLGQQNTALRYYYAGLQYVRETAFLQNAIEMNALAIARQDQPFTHQTGHQFANLPIKKAYCLGTRGKQVQSIPFLKQYHIPIEYFDTGCHWVAQDCLDEFCLRLDAFIKSCV